MLKHIYLFFFFLSCCGSLLGIKPNEKYQSYSPWGIERELPLWCLWGWWDTRVRKTELDPPWHMDVQLAGALKVKTILFLIIRRMSLPVVNKPNCFVAHPLYVSFHLCLHIFFVRKNILWKRRMHPSIEVDLEQEAQIHFFMNNPFCAFLKSSFHLHCYSRVSQLCFLFNGISIPHAWFNVQIWFICICLIAIINIYLNFQFFNINCSLHSVFIAYFLKSFLKNLTCTFHNCFFFFV